MTNSPIATPTNNVSPRDRQQSAESNDTTNALIIDEKDVEHVEIPVTTTLPETNTNGGVICSLCNAYLNSRIPYNDHLQGRRHKLAYQKILVTNPDYKEQSYDECLKSSTGKTQNNGNKPPEGKPAGSTLPPKSLLCDLCNITCSSQMVLDAHLKGKRHQKTLRYSRSKLAVNDDNSAAAVAQDKFSNLHKSVLEHTVVSSVSETQQSVVSKINFKEYETSKEHLKSQGYQYECKVCNRRITTKDDLIHHVNTFAHKNKVKLQRRQLTQLNRQILLKTRIPPRHAPQSQSNSTNIFGAFDPGNQYSHIFEAQLKNKSTPSNEPYSQQPCVNNKQDVGPQYSYSSYSNYQGTVSCPPVQYSYDYNYNPSEYSMNSSFQSSSTSNYPPAYSQAYYTTYDSAQSNIGVGRGNYNNSIQQSSRF